MFRRSNGLKQIDGQWHEERASARRNAFSLAEFSEPEIVRWDLDTANITGADNPRSFTYDPAIDLLGTAKVDVRDLPNR